jgi:hypothetical protein
MNKIKNRLKMVAAGAALATATGGVWGVEFAQPELLPRGTMSWDTSWLSVGNGAFQVPLDACICTAPDVVYDPNRPILIAFHLRAPTIADLASTTQTGDNASPSNVRKQRGCFDTQRLPYDLNVPNNQPKNLYVGAIVQYYPTDTNDQDILIRPDFAIIPATDAKTQTISLTKIKLGDLHKNGEKVSPNPVIFDTYESNNNKTLNIAINPSEFHIATDSIRTNLCVYQANQYDPQKDIISFSVYLQYETSDNSNSWGILTYITLLPKEPADKIKKAVQLASIQRLADDKYFNTLAAIYKTDLTSTATFAANLNAALESQAQPPATSETTLQDCHDKWQQLSSQDSILTAIKRLFDQQGGPRLITDLLFVLEPDYTFTHDYNNYGKNPLYKALDSTVFQLF